LDLKINDIELVPEPSPSGPGSQSLYHRTNASSVASPHTLRSPSLNKKSVANPDMLPLVVNLWKHQTTAKEQGNPLKPQRMGVPSLMPSWLQRRLSAMRSVSDQFSCAIAMALATELEQRMVDNIIKVSQ
jgi:hypothetical protein